MPVAILLSFLVVRLALVQADLSRAATFWPGHPAAMFESGLAEIGSKAVAGEPVDPSLVDRLVKASAKAPLSPEPFLVRGVEAEVAGDQRLALQAFIAARERNPRNVAARYFLADHYLKAGKVVPGLTEVSMLAQLVPQSLPNVAPFLAAFARSPGAAPQVRALLRSHPQLEPALLNSLATDAANTELILSIWSGRGGDEARPWQGRLLDQLVESGRYDVARATWEQFADKSGVPAHGFDPSFSSKALQPFGWVLASGPAGVAEPESAGRLHILYYGRDDLVLASQLMMLEPGKYRLSMRSDGTSQPKAMAWTVKCLPSATPIAEIPIDRGGNVSGNFGVPKVDCGAQKLELGGSATEFAEQADVTISQLSLSREARR